MLSRLKNFDYSSNGCYYVTIITHKRQVLFDENSPKQKNLIEKWILEIENKYCGVFIDKYVVMPNHIHFILRMERYLSESENSVSLFEMMKWFKTQTTNDYIRHVRDGVFPEFDTHIWRRNYYEHIIRNDDDFVRIWNYIEDNPRKWELKKGENSKESGVKV